MRLRCFYRATSGWAVTILIDHDGPESISEEYLQRIPIEGKFGQGKNGYRLNYIRVKRSRYFGCMDQQHLSGDEPADPVEDLFCAV